MENSKILEIGSFALKGSCSGEKLNFLYKMASKLIIEHEPDCVIAEDIFFSRKTAVSYKPLVKLQSIIELLAFRLNREEPIFALATEVRASHGIKSDRMKKDFVEYSKQNGYSKKKLSKNKLKSLYDIYKKEQIVKKVNDYYPNLLTNKQHDIADAVLLALHVESMLQ